MGAKQGLNPCFRDVSRRSTEHCRLGTHSILDELHGAPGIAFFSAMVYSF